MYKNIYFFIWNANVVNSKWNHVHISLFIQSLIVPSKWLAKHQEKLSFIDLVNSINQDQKFINANIEQTFAIDCKFYAHSQLSIENFHFVSTKIKSILTFWWANKLGFELHRKRELKRRFSIFQEALKMSMMQITNIF